MNVECPDCATVVALEETKNVGTFLECPQCAVGSPATSWLALAVDRANTARTELVLCLERARSSLEHHEEISQQHGQKEMHRRLYEQGNEAIRVLAKHRGALENADYRELVENFKA